MFSDENVVGSFMVFSVRLLPRALVGALIVPIGVYCGLLGVLKDIRPVIGKCQTHKCIPALWCSMDADTFIGSSILSRLSTYGSLKNTVSLIPGATEKLVNNFIYTFR